MTSTRRTRGALLVPAFVAVGLAAATIVGSPAQAANTKLTGTITWTRTVAIAENVDGDHTENGTETTTGSLKVAVKRNPQSYGSWNGTDKAGAYAGTYALSSTRNETDAFGTVDCVVTHAANGQGAGKVVVYGSIPSKKGIVVSANPRYTGTDTATYTGQGNSPCQSGQDVDPIDGSLLSNNDASKLCYPSGTSSKLATARAGDLVGAWNAKKKAFVFDCTRTYPENSDGGRTVTVKISGTLKWS